MDNLICVFRYTETLRRIADLRPVNIELTVYAIAIHHRQHDPIALAADIGSGQYLAVDLLERFFLFWTAMQSQAGVVHLPAFELLRDHGFQIDFGLPAQGAQPAGVDFGTLICTQRGRFERQCKYRGGNHSQANQ